MSASQPDSAEAYGAALRAAFDGVVAWIFQRGRLQQFPRVVHYVAKKNGGLGWEDSYQNLLVERICSSRWMKRETDALWSCVVDDSQWYQESVEWRMLAYKDQLTEVHRGNATALSVPMLGLAVEDKTYFSNDFFRTVGFEPTELERIDLKGTVRYLTALRTGEYLDVEAPRSADACESSRLTIWQRIRRTLGG